MKDILAKAQKIADEAEVYMVSVDETPVSFEANRLKSVQGKQSTSVALRIIKNGRVGYATSTDMADAQNLLDMALETAEFGMTARFKLPSVTSYPKIEIFDGAVAEVPIENMVKLGEELISRCTSNTPDLLCEATVSKNTVSVSIINSNGGQAEYRQSVFAISIEGQLIHETDMLFVGDNQSSCNPITQPDTVIERVLDQLEKAQNRATASTGSMPVIFTPNGVASALVMPLMAAFNGKTVLEGASPLANRIGETVFDEKLSLTDDPTIPLRPSSHPCDDEGVPTRKTILIDKGVVAAFLYDLQTAALAKTESTGNGRRGRGSLPSPAPSAFVVAQGDTSIDNMLADMKEGIVVEQLMGAGQGNILSGDFSGNLLLGYKVENGKITGRVKDTMISGNIYQLLKNITAIGNDSRWVGSFLNTPSIYLENVPVASK